MKKLFALIMALVITAAIVCVPVLGMAESAYTANEEASVDAYNALLYNYSNIKAFSTAEEAAEKVSEVKYSFPDEYAGAFIDNSGKLVVCVTGEAGKFIANSKALLENDKVEYKYVDYSHNQLMDAMQTVEKLMAIDDELGAQIVGAYTRYTDNVVIVQITDLNENITNRLQEQFIESDGTEVKQPMVRYEKGDYLIPEVSNEAGDRVAIEVSTAYGDEWAGYSVGFRARKYINGAYVEGFVTAAHGVETRISNDVEDGYGGLGILTPKVGEVVSHSMGGVCDASFIKNHGSHTVTNEISGSSPKLSYWLYGYYSVPENATIYKTGYSGGNKSGTVTSTNYSFSYQSYPNTVFSDFYKSNYSSSSGDSGGLVYYRTSTDTYIAGIHSGANNESTAACKAGNILSTLSLTLSGLE